MSGMEGWRTGKVMKTATQVMTEEAAFTAERFRQSLSGLRFFEGFPPGDRCFLCGKDDNIACILIGIDGTSSGNIEEATPVHMRCMVDRKHWRINRHAGVIYGRGE